MDEKKEDRFGFETMVSTLTDVMNAFWSSLGGIAPSPSAKPQTPPHDEKLSSSSPLDTMGRTMKNWQTLAAAMSAPESVSSLLRSAGVMPEVLAQLAQTAMGSFMELQRQAVQSAGRIGASVEAYRFENIDENIFHVWTDIYEKEFRQFFRIPQLGLARTHQEKLNTAIDAGNRFQSTLAEFLRLLVLPFNRTLAVMQDRMGELAENGALPEDSQVYYRMWIKVLEGHFMTLFQTPEYVETLGKTVSALAEFSGAKDAVLENMLRSFPVATRSELDDLAREVYELKKRIRRLEKRQPSKGA